MLTGDVAIGVSADVTRGTITAAGTNQHVILTPGGRARKPWLSVGSKSLLFGVHQFLWHPYTVGRAWRLLYDRWPTWREWICIFCHDLGYWGCPEMDGPCGQNHPIKGASIASWLLDRRGSRRWFQFTVKHSRKFTQHWAYQGHEPSELCWADKCSVLFDPEWFYLFRARLSGEIHEYRANADKSGGCSLVVNDGHWFESLKVEATWLLWLYGGPGWARKT